jgi:putative ABC transport system permease protein
VIRIAIRMLVGDVTKLMGVVLGVMFCTFLTTHMLSLFAGMMQRSYALVSDIPLADIWVMDPAVEYCDEPAGLPSTALRRVQSVPGVRWAVPLFTGSLRARLPSGQFRAVLLIGVDDATLVGAPAHIVEGRVENLRAADTVIVDTEGARTLLRMPVEPHPRTPGWDMPDFQVQTRPLLLGDELLINDHRVKIVGKAELGARFISKPILYTTYTRALQIAPGERNLLSFVLVKAAPDEDHRALALRIQEQTGLRARTRLDFEADTFWYYVRTTGVVGRIGFMVGLAMIVGALMSALLLYLFTSDNLRYYATLKALGTSDGAIVRMVIVQAALCGALGYGMGLGLSTTLARLISQKAMPYLLVWPSVSISGVAVLVVCIAAAALSARAVLKLEPAMVFRG